jgi:prepilin-type N-terminal cleavage/methylation domain-containing protein
MDKKFQNYGFTLVETLVAIAILSLSVMSASMAVQNSLSTSYYARDEVVAFNLIQEAVEYIRNMRDSNGLANISSVSSGGAGVNWLNGISFNASDPCYFGKYCTVDVSQTTLATCPTSGVATSCPYLNQNSQSGLFGYTSGGSWIATKFKRTILISPVAGDANEVYLTVTVSWMDNSNKNANVSVQEWLFNIR